MLYHDLLDCDRHTQPVGGISIDQLIPPERNKCYLLKELFRQG